MNKKAFFSNLLFLSTAFLIFFSSCKKAPIIKDDVISNAKTETLGQQSTKNGVKLLGRLANGSYTCGDLLSGRSPLGQPNGNYVYTDMKLDLSGVPNGATVGMLVDALDVPNKFSIKDASHSAFISVWRGTSLTPGPWGPSLNAPGSYQINFIKGVADIYYFGVETVISNNGTETWNAHLICTVVTPPCPTGAICDTPIRYKCSDPALLLSDRSALGTPNGAYRYYKKLDLSNIPSGTIMNVLVDALDVPNKFTITDANLQPIAYSPWKGTSSTTGPWGNSLNSPGSYLFSFTKGAASIYYLLVETVISNNGQDTWNTRIYCQ